MIKNKKLHIVFTDFDDIKNPLLGAGQAYATVAVGKRMAAEGHSVTVLCSNYPGAKDRTENGLIYKHIGISTKSIRINNVIYILTLPFYIKRLKNVDVIFECFTAPISTLFTPLFTKIPVIAIPTCFDAERFSTLYKFPFHKIEQLGLKRYKYFLPYTNALDKKMEKVNPTVTSKIVPEGVDNEFLEIKQKPSKHILFLGRFDINQKGIDLLLKAYAQIAKKISYPLVIAGHGPDQTKIENQIKDLGIADSVKIVGSAYGTKKNELLAESVCVAFPSRNEGFSLFSLEALASGAPLVAFNIPSLEWTDDSYVLKAAMFDVDEYATNLLKICTDNTMRQNMSMKAKEVAGKYTWDAVCREYLSFIYKYL